jgi:hypothetical protein
MDKANCHLGQLDRAARELEKVLRDPGVGAFEAGLTDGTALLLGELPAETVRTKLQAAIRYAVARDAVLAVGFLGHGSIVGNDPTLYFLAWDSRPDSPTTGINVSDVLVEAAGRLPGVLALIDTCHAAAGIPPSDRLNLGIRQGQEAIAVLAGATAFDYGYDMRLSRELAALLHRGVSGPDTGDKVGVAVAATALQPHLPGQRVVPLIFGQSTSLWIAANVAKSVRARRANGPGYAELQAALAARYPDRPVPDTADRVAIAALRKEEADAADRSPERSRLLYVTDCLHVARQTESFLTAWTGQHLTSAMLWRAFVAVDRGACRLSEADAHDLGWTLERVALTTPMSDQPNCRPRVVSYVIELIQETGYKPDLDRINDWARSIEAPVLVNDGLKDLRSGRRSRTMRLVVLLGTNEVDDWPDSIECWLMDGGTRLDWVSFDCPIPGRESCETALHQALDWTFEHEELAADGCRIEIAAPASVLLDWQPETSGADIWIGVDHDVVLHWSGRLSRGPLHIRNMRRRTKAMDRSTDPAPVDWLDREEVGDREGLDHQLAKGRFVKAIALKAAPTGDVRLFTRLLENTPILIWPHGVPATADHEMAVNANWFRLPAGFMDAYRGRWRGDGSLPLGDLRAVWDDDVYLEFAAHFLRSAPTKHAKAEEWTS